MRRIVYSVAISLDGYIADAGGGHDWIVMDPDMDFAALAARFDTLLMGRHTYELARSGGGGMMGMNAVVVSRTLRPADHPGVTILGEDWQHRVRDMREAPGKHIWLFGGGTLFTAMLDAGLVDGVELGIVPVLLGGGLPFLKPPARRAKLVPTGHELHPRAGVMRLTYDVARPEPGD